MSELKQKILEGIRASGLKEWAFMVNCYDDIAEYENLTDEDIDELATDILNEINKQPTLNENQQIVLEWLKADYIDDDESNPINSIWLLHDECAMGERSVAITAYTKLTNKQEAQVLQAFASWVEQEEE